MGNWCYQVILVLSLIDSCIGTGETSNDSGCNQTSIEMAHKLAKKGEYESALPYFNKAIDENTITTTPSSYFVERGICLEKLGYIQDAIKDYDKAQRIESPFKRVNPPYDT